MKHKGRMIVISLVICLGLIVLGMVASQQSPNVENGTAFFDRLVFGRWVNGRIYLEIPFNLTTLSSEERWKLFLARAVRSYDQYRDETDFTVEAENLDEQYIEAVTPYRLREPIRFRSVLNDGAVRLERYQIECSHNGCVLLGISEPVNVPAEAQQHVIIASKELPICAAPCRTKRDRPQPEVLRKITATLQYLVQYPPDSPKEYLGEQVIVYAGHFTRTDQVQYIAYINRHSKDAPGEGNWMTVILDSNLSPLATLGQNTYDHIVPVAVGDLNGDSFDELWVMLSGFESVADGIMYLRSVNPPTFGTVHGQ